MYCGWCCTCRRCYYRAPDKYIDLAMYTSTKTTLQTMSLAIIAALARRWVMSPSTFSTAASVAEVASLSMVSAPMALVVVVVTVGRAPAVAEHETAFNLSRFHPRNSRAVRLSPLMRNICSRVGLRQNTGGGGASTLKTR